jgi:hypothetical protein
MAILEPPVGMVPSSVSDGAMLGWGVVRGAVVIRKLFRLGLLGDFGPRLGIRGRHNEIRVWWLKYEAGLQ